MGRYEVTSGVRRGAVKALVYGHEGIGKSTLAAGMPHPLFVDVEGGTSQLDVSRLPRPTSWSMLVDEVRAVRDGELSCSTLCLDTADAAQALCVRKVCADNGYRGIEDAGYGKGYTYVLEEFGRLVNLLGEVVERGVNVVVLCHAILSKFERPDESGAYDRWSLKLIDSKRTSVAALLKEWADMVLFCDYKVVVTKDSKTGVAKASGGRRVVKTTHGVTFDAKNRFGLPDEMPLDEATTAALAALMADRAAAPREPAAPPILDAATMEAVDRAIASGERAMAPARAAPASPGWPSRMGRLADLMRADGVTEGELRAVVGASGNYPEACDPTDYEQGFVDFLVAQWPTMLDRVRAERARKIETPF